MVRVNVLAVQVSSGQEEGHFYAWCFLRIVNVRIYYLIECTIVKILVTIFMLRSLPTSIKFSVNYPEWSPPTVSTVSLSTLYTCGGVIVTGNSQHFGNLFYFSWLLTLLK
jgi:hypothetical protein